METAPRQFGNKDISYTCTYTFENYLDRSDLDLHCLPRPVCLKS